MRLSLSRGKWLFLFLLVFPETGLLAKTWDGAASAAIGFAHFIFSIDILDEDRDQSAVSGGEQTVDFKSLLQEMVDRDRLARFPAPDRRYTCSQASSYERTSISPDKRGWYANNDWSHFIRSEMNNGRKEWVMMDARGPGCITRMWMGGVPPYGKLRFYIDGNQTPVITGQVEDIMGSDALVGAPFSAIRARGRNLYLPLPYQKKCKVTYDGRNFWESGRRDDRTWYIINYRTYKNKALKITSFAKSQLAEAASLVKQTGDTLLNPAGHIGEITDRRFKKRSLSPGENVSLSMNGPMALRKLSVRVMGADTTQVLDKTAIRLQFDGKETVHVPVGHFFGSGTGFHPFRGWYREVKPDGLMSCWWVMPFQRSAMITLENSGAAAVQAELGLEAGPWNWDARSMHFHSQMREEKLDVTGRAGRDWNFVTIPGRGVFVGDTLSIHNGTAAWWGEGDEKIRVDGEAFPSIFGTGTEDYYGYSYGNPSFFEAPFHAQPTGAGNSRVGYTTNTRSRSLDAIPFTKSLQFDMEVWHWASCTITYKATTYWYRLPE